MLFQHLLNGVTIGSSYALIALGYTLVYGVLKLINFAHGEMYMIGAYLGYIIITLLPYFGDFISSHMLLLIPLVFVIAAILCSLTGFYLEKICYKPTRNAPRLSPLISALGASIFFQNFVMLTMGPKDKIFPHIFTIEQVTVGDVTFSYVQIGITVFSLTMMALLHWFINKTKIGVAIKAVSTDHFMASLLGINVDTVISVTFMIGSFLAAGAGIMLGLYYGVINFSIGYLAGIKAFTAAVLGGIGNVNGAMAGGIILGVVEALGAGYFSTEYKDVYAFVILIGVLIFKPAGLLGRKLNERA